MVTCLGNILLYLINTKSLGRSLIAIIVDGWGSCVILACFEDGFIFVEVEQVETSSIGSAIWCINRRCGGDVVRHIWSNWRGIDNFICSIVISCFTGPALFLFTRLTRCVLVIGVLDTMEFLGLLSFSYPASLLVLRKRSPACCTDLGCEESVCISGQIKVIERPKEEY